MTNPTDEQPDQTPAAFCAHAGPDCQLPPREQAAHALPAALAALFTPEQLDDLHADAWRLSLPTDTPSAADWGTLVRLLDRARTIADAARREQPDQTPAWRWLDNATDNTTRCPARAVDQHGNPHRCNKPRHHDAGHAWLAELPTPDDLTHTDTEQPDQTPTNPDDAAAIAEWNNFLATSAAPEPRDQAPTAIDAFKQRVQAHRAAGHPGGVGGCKTCPTPAPAAARVGSDRSQTRESAEPARECVARRSLPPGTAECVTPVEFAVTYRQVSGRDKGKLTDYTPGCGGHCVMVQNVAVFAGQIAAVAVERLADVERERGEG